EAPESHRASLELPVDASSIAFCVPSGAAERPGRAKFPPSRTQMAHTQLARRGPRPFKPSRAFRSPLCPGNRTDHWPGACLPPLLLDAPAAVSIELTVD